MHVRTGPGAWLRSAPRALTMSVLTVGLSLYLPLHLAGTVERLLGSPGTPAAALVAALFAIPLFLVFTLLMPLLINPMGYLWTGVAMEGLVVSAFLWGRTGRVSRLLLVLIALAVPTGPLIFAYHPALGPAPAHRMEVPTQPEPLEGVVKQAERWMEIVPSKYTLLGWGVDGEEVLYYREATRGGAERLWAFKPGEARKPAQLAGALPGLRDDARLSVLERVRAPGVLRPEDEPSVRAVHARGDGIESPSGRWIAVLAKWVYGPEDVIVLSRE